MNDHDTFTASDLISNTMDSFCYEIILDPMARAQKNDRLKYFMDQIESTKSKRLQTCMALVDLILRLDGDQNDSEAKLDYWDYKKWTEFVKDFQNLRDELAPKAFTDNDLFTKRFIDALKFCNLQRALSVIRLEVEDAMNMPKGSDILIDEHEEAGLYTFIQENFTSGDGLYEHLTSLFKTTRGMNVKLKPVRQIDQIMKSRKDLSIERFVKVLERLLQNWYVAVFPSPIWVMIGYSKARHDTEKDNTRNVTSVIDNINNENDERKEEEESEIQLEDDQPQHKVTSHSLDNISTEVNKNMRRKKDDEVHAQSNSEETEDEENNLQRNNDDSGSDESDKPQRKDDDMNNDESDFGSDESDNPQRKGGDIDELGKPQRKDDDTDSDESDNNACYFESPILVRKRKRNIPNRYGKDDDINSDESGKLQKNNDDTDSDESDNNACYFESPILVRKRKRNIPNRYATEFIGRTSTLAHGAKGQRVIARKSFEKQKTNSFAIPNSSQRRKRKSPLRFSDQNFTSNTDKSNTMKTKSRDRGGSRASSSVVFDLEEVRPIEIPGKAFNLELDSQSSDDSILSEKHGLSKQRPKLSTPSTVIRIKHLAIQNQERNIAPKRKKWTYEEKEAVVKGYQKHGSKWIDIKKEYPILENRTNIQIKDCYRSILKQEEANERVLT